MIQIRKGIFETNSSSTHSISVVQEEHYELPKNLPPIGEPIVLEGDQYGWENSEYYDWLSKANYLATYAYNYGRQQDVDLLKFVIKEFTNREVILEVNPRDTWIDHQSSDIPVKLFKDAEQMKAFIFGKNSYLETGNDNE